MIVFTDSVIICLTKERNLVLPVFPEVHGWKTTITLNPNPLHSMFFAGRKQSNLGPTSVWVLLSGCSQPSPRPRSRPGGLQVGPRDEEAFGRLPDRHEAPAPLPRAARVGRQRILPRQVHGADPAEPAEPAETGTIGRRRRRFGRRTRHMRHMRHMHPFFRGHDSKTTDCDSKTTDCAVPTRFKCCVNHVPI